MQQPRHLHDFDYCVNAATDWVNLRIGFFFKISFQVPPCSSSINSEAFREAVDLTTSSSNRHPPPPLPPLMNQTSLPQLTTSPFHPCNFFIPSLPGGPRMESGFPGSRDFISLLTIHQN